MENPLYLLEIGISWILEELFEKLKKVNSHNLNLYI